MKYKRIYQHLDASERSKENHMFSNNEPKLVHTAKGVKIISFLYWLAGILMGAAAAALILTEL